MLSTFFDDLYYLNKQMNRFFGDYGNNTGTTFRAANIYENNDEYIVITKLPGVKKEDINITLKDNALKISGERKKEDTGKLSEHMNERFYGSFERNFILNEKVNIDNIKAKMENGLLMIKIPKSPESKPKKIEIK